MKHAKKFLVAGALLLSAFLYLGFTPSSASAAGCTQGSVICNLIAQIASLQAQLTQLIQNQGQQNTTNNNLKTYTNTQLGLSLQYPTVLNSSYFHLNSVSAVSDSIDIDSSGCYVPSAYKSTGLPPSGKGPISSNQDVKVTLDNIVFCQSDDLSPGAGQFGGNYYYTTLENSNYYTLEYSVSGAYGCGALQNDPNINAADNANYRACLSDLNNYNSIVVQPIQQSAGTLTFAPATTSTLKGDCNLDGVVSSADAALAAQWAIDVGTPTAQQITNCAITNGKYITSSDVTAINRYLAGYPWPTTTATVTVSQPTVSFNATNYSSGQAYNTNPVTVTVGTSVNFAYTSTNATSCTVDQDSVPMNNIIVNGVATLTQGATSGNWTSQAKFPNSSTFTVTCTNASGQQVSKSITMTSTAESATITSSAQTTSLTPTISGTATGTTQVGVVLTQPGQKIYGSGLVSVVNGNWSATVSPAIAVGQYTVIIYDANSNQLTTGSLGVTSSISTTTLNPTITVATPGTLTQGQQATVTWTTTGTMPGSGNGNIVLMSSGGVGNVLASGVPLSAGMYSWTVPASATPGSYQIEIYNIYNATPTGYSGTFSIVAPTITQPVAAASFILGDPLNAGFISGSDITLCNVCMNTPSNSHCTSAAITACEVTCDSAISSADITAMQNAVANGTTFSACPSSAGPLGMNVNMNTSALASISSALANIAAQLKALMGK